MKVLLFGLAGVIATGVIVFVIGSLLPQAHVARRTARYRQSPETIWHAITDYANFAAWRTDVRAVEPITTASGNPAWREKSRSGDIPIEIVESQAPSRLVTRIADPRLPFGGTWTFEITRTPDGAQLSITENGEVYNPIFRFVSRFIMGHSATIEAYLRALGKKFGENVTPQP
ncbi:MAG TPA: SRPBCC family protein [Terriglobales bacterium]|nr:SRPBCC family protein [Terriglobales bacterium]